MGRLTTNWLSQIVPFITFRPLPSANHQCYFILVVGGNL